MPDIVKYVRPVPPGAASGLTADLYAQSKKEIGRLVEPVTMFSPSLPLLLGSWGAFRESLLASGRAPRMAKEVVAARVSQLNECQFCVDAHTIMLYGGGAGGFATQLLTGLPLEGEYRDLASWVDATATSAGARRWPPFPAAQALEFIGVLVYFQFLNRMINVLLSGSFPPGSKRSRGIARRVVGRLMARVVATDNAPGQAVGLPTDPLPLPDDLGWAAGSPQVAAAFAALAAAVDETSRMVPETVRAIVVDNVNGWAGESAGLGSSWAQDLVTPLAAAARPAARLAGPAHRPGSVPGHAGRRPGLPGASWK